MKALYLLMIVVWTFGSVTAQNVTQVEYFIDDTDKGHGKNTPIPLTAGTDLTASYTIPLTNISPGFHILYLRAKNADNKWGVTIQKVFFVDKKQRPVNITRFEYYYVNSAGTPSTKYTYNLPVPAPSVDLAFPGETKSLVVGQRYTLYLWAYNEAGERSLLNTTAFTYSECTNVPKPQLSIADGVENISSSLTLTCNQTGVTYQWLLNGNPINGATQKNYAVKATDFGPNGAAFSVRTTQTSGCSATSDPLAITGTEDWFFTKAQFQLYPNPVREQLTVSYPARQGAKAVRAIIFNAKGEKIGERDLQQTDPMIWETRISTGSYAPGLYLIRLEDREHGATKSFVKQ